MTHRRTDNADQSPEFLYGWIPASAAIAHLGLGSTSALYRLIETHNLPYGRVGRHYRFRRGDLDQWASVRQNASAMQRAS